eukprot:755413-Hanusia_phi.AAC.5
MELSGPTFLTSAGPLLEEVRTGARVSVPTRPVLLPSPAPTKSRAAAEPCSSPPALSSAAGPHQNTRTLRARDFMASACT